jgi:hypothetical protein
VIVVAAAAMTLAAVTAAARTMAMGATALVMIALVALAIAHFVTCRIVATANTCVVTIIAIAFVATLTIAPLSPTNRPHHCPLLPSPLPSLLPLSMPSLMPPPSLLPLSPSPLLWLLPPLSSTPATLLPSQLGMLSSLPSLDHHPCCHSHCFLCHHQCHCRLIVVQKRLVMATAAAMAALRAMALGICGGGSSNEDGCHDSGGEE